jgi:hypothetical protein
MIMSWLFFCHRISHIKCHSCVTLFKIMYISKGRSLVMYLHIYASENRYPNLRHCSEIFLETLRKNRKDLAQQSRNTDRCVKSGLSEYKTLPLTRLGNSVRLKTFMNSRGFRIIPRLKCKNISVLQFLSYHS